MNRHVSIVRMWLLGMSCGLVAVPAAAQQLPNAVQPIVPSERLQPPKPTPAPPRIDAETGASSVAPPGADTVRFDLSGIEIDGGTVYSEAEIAALHGGAVGTTVSLADIYDIAARLEAKYRGDGYFLTRVLVPAQRIEDGRVRLMVVEGFIASVEVRGNPGGAADLVRRTAASATGSRPTRLDDVERALLLVNDMPGIRARGTIGALPGELGASQLTVDVAHDAVDGFANVDNRGSRYAGPWGATVGAGINSLTPLAERIDVVGYNTLGDFGEQHVLQTNGEIGLNENGLRAYATFAYTWGEPGDLFSLIDLETDAIQARLGLTYPLLRSRRASVWLDGAFDFYNQNSDSVGGVIKVRDRLRVFRLTARGELQDGWAGFNRGEIGIHAGADILGASTGGDPFRSRSGASAAFWKLTAEYSRLQRLAEIDWGSFFLQGLVGGQFSNRPLLSSEEFRLGGYRFGRGFVAGELGGDSGIGASAELQFNASFGIPVGEEGLDVPFQLYGFYDVGTLWNEDSGADRSASLASAGGGVRGFITSYATAEIEVAKPLTRSPLYRGGPDRGPIVYFRLVGTF